MAENTKVVKGYPKLAKKKRKPKWAQNASTKKSPCKRNKN
jgi:hypothetical protein